MQAFGAVLAVYALMSLVLFFVYGLDKSAAKRGGSRTPEWVLHLLALLGGWPGAPSRNACSGTRPSSSRSAPSSGARW